MKSLPLYVALAFALCTIACSSRFSEADVQRTESDIRTQFEQKGFVVEQVSTIKDSDRHLSGFAKVRKPGLILGKLEMTKNCIATMDADSGKFIWECK
jgi:virulence-associated protein VapD